MEEMDDDGEGPERSRSVGRASRPSSYQYSGNRFAAAKGGYNSKGKESGRPSLSKAASNPLIVKRKEPVSDLQAVSDSWANHQEAGKRLQKLQKTIQERKKQSRLLQHRNHWVQEALQLQKERKKAEGELRKCLQSMPQLQYAEMELDENRETLAATLTQQLRTVRGMARANGDRSAVKVALAQLNDSLTTSLQMLQKEQQQLEEEDTLLPDTASIATSQHLTYDMLANMVEARLAEIHAKVEELEWVDKRLLELLESSVQDKLREVLIRVSEIEGLAPVYPSLPPHDEARFRQVVKAYKGSGGVTHRREISDRLKLEFPNLDERKVQELLWGMEVEGFTRKRVTSLLREHKAALESTLRAIPETMEHACALHLAHEAAKKEAAARIAQQEAMHKKLQEMRDAKQERDDLITQKKLEEEAARLKEKMELEARRNAEFQERLRKLAEYREQQKLAEERAAELRREEEALRHEQFVQQSQYNAERVAHREAELRQKREELARRRERLEREQHEREEALQQLAQSVAPQVERSRERAQQATAASSAVPEKDAMPINEAAFGKAANKVYGYTTAEVMKDKRFKLTEALGKAGLLNTDYAKFLIFQSTANNHRGSKAMFGTTEGNPFYVNHTPGPPS